jgi:Flp pilus assembly protein TadG
MFAAFFRRLRRGALLPRTLAVFSDFRSDVRGNVAVITALAMLPMISAVGCAMDYTMATMIRTKLQAAADAAALTTVSNNSSIVAAAKAMSGSGTVSGGSTYATKIFSANLSTSPENIGYSSVSPTATVTKSGMTVTTTVAFTAQYPTFFLQVMGFQNLTLSGTSTASVTLPTYINFYLMLDVSGSMSFPSTASEQARLMAVNTDNLTGSIGYPQGCQFACHFSAQGACQQNPQSGWQVGQGPIPAVGSATNPSPGGYCQGFNISRVGTSPTSFTSGTTNPTNGNSVNWGNTPVLNCPSAGTTSCIQLRADAVGYAVNELLQTAYNTELSTGISNQYKVGLYPFIEYLYSYFPLTASLNGSTTNSSTINYAAANLASLLDTGTNSNLGSGGTHFENALPSMNSLISSVGTGSSSSNALPYVFLITDGSEDPQTQWGANWSGSNQATTLNPSLCTTLKNRGITVAVLYIPYQPIQDPNPTFANNEDGAANANIPNIPGALQSCASPNFFYTANAPADINSALVTMFEQAVSTAHVTN